MLDNVKVEKDGEVVDDWRHVLVSGTGFLNSWKRPKIEGLHDFQGQLMHSALWDASANF